MIKEPNYFEDELIDNSSVLNPKDGEILNLNGISVTFKVTSELSNNQLGVYEIKLPPKTIGAKFTFTIDLWMKTFIVNKGILTIEAGDKTYRGEPGTVAYIPRFTPHGFRNDTDEHVHLLLIFNPSEKREGFFKGLHETLSEVPVKSEKKIF